MGREGESFVEVGEQVARLRDVLFGLRGGAPGSWAGGGGAGGVQAAEQHPGLPVDLRLAGLGGVRAAGGLAGQRGPGSAVIRTARRRGTAARRRGARPVLGAGVRLR
jgi:hypothetical protein